MRAIELESRPLYSGATNTSVLRVSTPEPHTGYAPLNRLATFSMHTGGASVIAYLSADDCLRLAAALTSAASALNAQQVAA